MTVYLADRVLTPTGILAPGYVAVDGGVITAVGSGAPPADVAANAVETINLGDVTLTPGFVDIHSHGGGGYSFSDGPDAARRALAAHRAHGTTSMVASLVTASIPDLARQIRSLLPLVESAELLGIHLEGRWLSPSRAGAHDPSLLISPDDSVAQLLEAARLPDGRSAVVMVTLAPELPGAVEATRKLTDAGVTVAVGHSDASFEETAAVFAAGARGATHLFNGMRPLHHREGGVAAAALANPECFVELIADGVHVASEMLRLAVPAARGQVVLVTDAMAAAGVADGEYQLGGIRVTVSGGVARTPSGALAGSTLTLDAAIRTMVNDVGLALADAVAAATVTPADVLGRRDLGRIEVRARADLVALDQQLRVIEVISPNR